MRSKLTRVAWPIGPMVFAMALVALVTALCSRKIREASQAHRRANLQSKAEYLSELSRDPRDTHAMEQLAALAAMESRFDEAVSYLKRCIVLDGESEHVLQQLALLHVERSHYERDVQVQARERAAAVTCASKLRDLLRESASPPLLRIEGWETAGCVLAACGKTKEAAVCFGAALRGVEDAANGGLIAGRIRQSYESRLRERLAKTR